MAPPQRFGNKFCSLAVLSLAAQRTASSLLTQSNGIVPDYVLQHAPLVWLHSEDPFRPSDLLEHVRHTTPALDQRAISGLPALDLDNLSILEDYGGRKVALTADDDPTTLPTWLFGAAPDSTGRIHGATPCVVILVEKTPVEVDAFFFYFYSYNQGGNISQVLQPIKSLLETEDGAKDGLHFGDHVGDWEHNMVRFVDGKPTGVYYSQHASGAAYDWQDAELSIKNERPIVFSAIGSHANYVSEGHHVHDVVLVDICDAGLLWDPVLAAYFYHLDPTSNVLTRMFPPGPPPDKSNLTDFLYFHGMWGDAKYPDDNPRQLTVPYFGLKRFESGPTGPYDKQLVRRGLFPDHPSPVSWVEWGVGVFMWWYPCCLRGWRKWVSGAVFIGLLALAVLGVVYGVKRLRKTRQYTKIDTEIPMEDMDAREYDTQRAVDTDEGEALTR
ncbi:hypothetical protein GQ53DRAFT_743982 [Thozetella sp. PMI_491]|nr:hypothetical protein GQ53DRAFT_743982 [Thozetella sp. PMI_491]